MQSLYPIIKEAHSGWRWIVLIMAIAVVIDFAMGMMSKRAFKPLDNRISLLYIIAIDIQLVLGLLLYFVLSPITQNALQFGANTLDDPNIRFYSIEHPVVMLLAIVFAHVGRAISKKASTDAKKFQRGAICFGIALVLLLSRMPGITYSGN